MRHPLWQNKKGGSIVAKGIEKMIAETFLAMAEGLETGSFGKRPKIALTGMGS